MIGAIDTALMGMQNASRKIATAADNIATPEKQGNMATDIIDIKVAEVSFKANAAVIRASSDMQDELLHLFDEEV